MLAIAIGAVTTIARHTAIAAVAADPAGTNAAATVDHEQHPTTTGPAAGTTHATGSTITGGTASTTRSPGYHRIRTGRPGTTDTADTAGTTNATGTTGTEHPGPIATGPTEPASSTATN